MTPAHMGFYNRYMRESLGLPNTWLRAIKHHTKLRDYRPGIHRTKSDMHCDIDIRN